VKSSNNETPSARLNWDRQEFEEVYRTYKDDLYTATVCLLGGDTAAAEDVLHDVFVALARRADEWEFTSSVRNYLLTSCLNRARDVLRHRGREKSSEETLRAQLPTVPDPSTMAGTTDEAVVLITALGLLPADQREVVTLHIHGQMKFREIAELLEISINTVQSRYRYALSALRTMLAEKER